MPWCINFPFSGCVYSLKLVSRLINELNIEQFVETGTFVGKTTEYLASVFPKMKIITVELDENYFRQAKNNLKFSNITFVNSSSDEFLKKENSYDPSKRTIFYLDAHVKGSYPLRDEIKAILEKSRKNELIIIDDFKVPNRNFDFDLLDENSTGCKCLEFDYIKDLFDWNEWYYFYKSSGENSDMKPTGQIYIANKNLKLPDTMIFYENNIPYSKLTF